MKMENVEVAFTWLDPDVAKDLQPPSYESELAAGMDVRAAVPDPVILAPGAVELLPTGLAVALPPGYELQVRPRSGLAIRHGVTVINAPGTIDADYRGEIRVGLINHGREPFTIQRGDRIAQLILAPVCRAVLCERESLDETKRGTGGFGHTGV